MGDGRWAPPLFTSRIPMRKRRVMIVLRPVCMFSFWCSRGARVAVYLLIRAFDPWL